MDIGYSGPWHCLADGRNFAAGRDVAVELHVRNRWLLSLPSRCRRSEDRLYQRSCTCHVEVGVGESCFVIRLGLQHPQIVCCFVIRLGLQHPQIVGRLNKPDGNGRPSSTMDRGSVAITMGGSVAGSCREKSNTPRKNKNRRGAATGVCSPKEMLSLHDSDRAGNAKTGAARLEESNSAPQRMQQLEELDHHL